MISAVPSADVSKATKILKQREPCLRDWGHKQVMATRTWPKATEAVGKELKSVTEIHDAGKTPWGPNERCKRFNDKVPIPSSRYNSIHKDKLI